MSINYYQGELNTQSTRELPCNSGKQGIAHFFLFYGKFCQPGKNFSNNLISSGCFHSKYLLELGIQHKDFLKSV